MNQAILDRLERIQYSPTAYEIVLISPDGNRSYFLGYTERRTRSVLIEMIERNCKRVIEATTCDLMEFKRWNRSGIVLSKYGIDTGWRVRYSGRTKRQSIIEGEIPWIGSVDLSEGIGGDR